MSESLRERLEAARARQRGHTPGPPRVPCNYLILSDTHLGEYIKEHSRIEFLKRAAEIDHDLCEFLDYYADHTRDEKPWRLIINGDFLDFLTVTVTPSEHAQADNPDLALDEEERIYGLDNDEEKVAWKFDRIADRHQVVLAYLADFVGRGHYLDMLYGNHDAEFFWDSAKKTFVRHLTNVFFGSEKVPGQTEEEFANRIRWHEWFYYEEGRFYIEHGNQYDDFSSFQYRLNPVFAARPDRLAMPASHMVIRYFVNRLEGFRTHNKDAWTLWDFLGWLIQQGWSRTRFIISSFIDLARRLLAYSKTIQLGQSAPLAERHQERLEREAVRYGVDPEILGAIDDLRRRPVHESRGPIIQGVALDQVGLYVGFALSLVVALLLPGWRLKLVTSILWVALVIGRRQLLKAVRNRFLGGEVSTFIPPKLEHAARQIAELVETRYVIFGHTHRPVVEQVREEPPVWYINLGCWLPPKYKEHHQGGCRSPLTYCELLDRGVPEAQLLRWCQRNNRPEPFLPHLEAEADVPEQTQLRKDADSLEPLDGDVVAARARRSHPNRSHSRVSLRKKRY